MLAVISLCLRDVFFEKYVLEKYPPLDEATEAIARDLAAGPGTPEQLETLAREQAEKQPGKDRKSVV